MINPKYAFIFSHTSIWMLIPLISAIINKKLLFANSIIITMIASIKHWQYLIYNKNSNKIWQNIDRIGVISILFQIEYIFLLPIIFLFIIGAIILLINSKKKNNLHLICHILCRYISFWACCYSSNHLNNLWINLQIIIYSLLYLIHIYIIYIDIITFNKKKIYI